MRILHLTESLELGGAEKVVVALANHQAETHDVAICCVKTIGVLAADLDRRIRVLCLDKGEGNDYLLPFRLARILRSGAYDVLHTHDWGVFLEGGLAGILARTRALVHTVHGPYRSYPDHALGRAKLALRHLLERLLAPRFRGIATVSDAVAHYVANDIAIDPALLRTVHNGIDITSAGVLERPRGQAVVFVTTGRLAAIKNHTMMIGGLRRVIDAGVPARLVIAGDGPERGRIENCVREHGLQDQVSLLGFRSDVRPILAGADIFLMTSRYEGISIAMLEAMRAGLPVVATRVGGVPETVRDRVTGLLVGPDDLAGLAEAMLRLARSPALREEMGRHARDFLAAEFSLAQMAHRYFELYLPSPASSSAARP